MKTLDILIPTYGRPTSAISSIDSLLQVSDSRFVVRCSSNKIEPALEKYIDSDSRVIYNSFEKNIGAKGNFLHLLKQSQSRFCMLLSDEDRLDPNALPKFLDFLDSLLDKVKVISCSIFDEESNKYYHKPNKKLESYLLDKDAFAALDLLPSYISGTVYLVSALKLLHLDGLHGPTPGNAYPHLDVAQVLLLEGVFRFYSSHLVIKGKEVRQGGGAFSHLSGLVEKKSDNKNLNPEVYGPYARTRQFYYRDKFYSQLKNDLSWIALIIVKISLVQKFLRAVWASPQVVVLPGQMKCEVEAERAYCDSVKHHEFSGSISSRIFRHLVILPSFSHRIVSFLFRGFSILLKKIYKNLFLKTYK